MQGTPTISSAECIFSKYIFFCNGELQVVSVSEAQKCIKGCNIATKRQTCLDYLRVPVYK